MTKIPTSEMCVQCGERVGDRPPIVHCDACQEAHFARAVMAGKMLLHEPRGVAWYMNYVRKHWS